MMALIGNSLALGAVLQMSGVATSAREVTRIQCVGDVAGSLDGKYFVIHDAAGSVGVYFDAGSASPPAGVDRTIQCIYQAGVSPNTEIAATLAAELNGDSQFEALVDDDAISVVVTDAVPGARTNAADVDTGFTITVQQQGAAA